MTLSKSPYYGDHLFLLEMIYLRVGRTGWTVYQKETLMFFIKLSERYADESKEVKKIDLQKAANVSSSIITELVKKNIFEIYEVAVDRIGKYDKELIGEKTLNEHQEKAFGEIKEQFKEKDVILLHGVTSSGKTGLMCCPSTIFSIKSILFIFPF